jgi:hypothetical protein
MVVALELPKSNQVEKRERVEEGERGKQRGVAERPGITGILKLLSSQQWRKSVRNLGNLGALWWDWKRGNRE